MNTTTLKRQPTLADQLLATRGSTESLATNAWTARALDDLTLAHKFVLDGQAAIYIAQMLRDHPRIVADAQDFAQRPFERMWVEMPFQAFYSTITGLPPNLITGDRRVGYLFDGPRVVVASLGAEFERAGIVPIEYILNRPMTVRDELELCAQVGTSRLGLDFWYWGSSANRFSTGLAITEGEAQGWAHAEAVGLDEDSAWNAVALRSLRANHSVRIAPMKVAVPPEHWTLIVENSAGDLRNIIALLLFLNRTQDIQTSHAVPHARGFINRRLSPYTAHRIISLKVNPLPRLRRLVAGEGVRRALHDVRGHYKHDRRAWAGCQHSYDADLAGDFGTAWIECEPLRWKCEMCGGRRWWQPEHSRGSLEAGLVRSSYAVTR